MLRTPRLALLLCLFAQASSAQTYRLYRTAAAPKLDGRVQADAAWAAIPRATGFYRLGGDYTVAKQTTVQAAWDENNLYVAAVCEEPDIAKVAPIQKDGGDVWTDDSVELFLKLPGQLGVVQLVVNTAGARAVGEGPVELNQWQAAASKGADGWAVEIRVPFAALAQKPKPGDVWRGTLCRNIFVYTSGGDKFTCWSPLQSRFREPEHFAELRFSADALSPTQAKAASDALNRAYRGLILSELKTLARDAPKYLREIERCLRKSRFAKEAASLHAQWLKAQRLTAQADAASIEAVREVLRDAARLRQRSYVLKYRALIEELFED